MRPCRSCAYHLKVVGPTFAGAHACVSSLWKSIRLLQRNASAVSEPSPRNAPLNGRCDQGAACCRRARLDATWRPTIVRPGEKCPAPPSVLHGRRHRAGITCSTARSPALVLCTCRRSDGMDDAASPTLRSHRRPHAALGTYCCPLQMLAHPLHAHPDSHLIYDPLQVNLSHRHGVAQRAAAIGLDEQRRQPTPGSCASVALGGAEQLGPCRRDDGERGGRFLWPYGVRAVSVRCVRRLRGDRHR